MANSLLNDALEIVERQEVKERAKKNLDLDANYC